MGATYVTVTVRNPEDPHRAWEGVFLVDTGATDCLVPRKHLESIGLVPEGQRVYGLADGSYISMDITKSDLELMGEVAGATVVMGEDDAEPLLGVTFLEDLKLEVVPVSQTLKKMP